jgi:hypothetical protein
MSLRAAKLPDGHSGPAFVVSSRVERLVEEGDGSGVGDPGSLTAGGSNLPALRDQRGPAAVDADLPGRCAFSADPGARKPAGTLTAIVFLGRGPLSR